MRRISVLLLILFISFCGGSEVSNNESLISSTSTTTTTVADSTTTSTTTTTVADSTTTSTTTTTVADSTTTSTTTTTTSTTTTSTTTTTVVSVDYPQLIISEISSSIPEYDRDDWNHWIDENGDCQNTRHEVLIEESFESVIYTNDTYCSVSTGKWFGYYTGQYYYNASDLDIDHFIPLKNAHQSGGYSWSSTKKEEFANYRLDPDNLIAVNLSANRSKGAKGPDEWKPSNTEYWCEYAFDWIRIKDYWNLTATQAEWNALVSMIETCPSGFNYADAQQEPVVELPTPTTTTTTTTTIPQTTTTTTVASSQPDNPGDTKNCGDFANYSEAKAWFDTYYEYYGDVANLDGDNDGEPCESLPGGP
ncbi:HNH endonuclease family protein [Acidimicrobiaceae bacterium]|nr:HNH endonuclease family protein [Acidimicrobiaceae bacterium]